MVKNAKNSSRSRRPKPTKVIDLEVNEKTVKAGSEAKAETNEIDQPLSQVDEKSTKAQKESSPVDANDSDISAETRKPSEDGASNDDAPVEKKTGTSIGALVLSALLGGGVALGGAGLLGQGLVGGSGLFGGGNSESVNTEIKSIKDQIADLSQSAGALSTESDGRIAKLEDRLAAISDTSSLGVNASDPKAAEALNMAETASSKVDDIAKQISDLNSRIVDGAGNGNVDIGALKTALTGDLSKLTKRIAALESGGGDTKAVSSEITALGGQVEALKQTVASVEAETKTVSENVASFGARLDTLEASVKEKILPSMNSVEKAATAAIESQKVARSLSARSLGTVLENGGSFVSELASAEAMIGANDSIDGLRNLARKGVRSKKEIKAAFGPVSDKIISLQKRNTTSMGIMDRLLSSAQTLVKVRPAGTLEGDSNDAIVTRIKAALDAGDLKTALHEWDRLDDKARVVSADWAQTARDHLKAEGLISKLINALSTSSNGQG